jgi:hypothetical protein
MATKDKKKDSKPVVQEKENPMREIRIEKLVLNISVGESGDKLTKGTIFLIQQAKFYKISLDKSQSLQELALLLEVLVLKETKKLQSMSLSEEIKLTKFWREVLKSKIDN